MISRLVYCQLFTPLEEGRAAAPREHEINLVELGVAPVRTWQAVVGNFLFSTPINVILALLKNYEYAYSAGIQLAVYVTSSVNSVQLLYPPDSVKSLLQRGLINASISHCAQMHKGFDPGKIKHSAEVPKGGNVVFLSSKDSHTFQNAYAVIIDQMVVDLTKNTSSPIESYLESLQNILPQVQIELSTLNDLKGSQADKFTKKRALPVAQTRMASLQQDHKFLQQKLDRLNESIKLYAILAKLFSEYIDAIRRFVWSANGANMMSQDLILNSY